MGKTLPAGRDHQAPPSGRPPFSGRERAWVALVFLVASVSFGLFGFEGELRRDDAIYVYSGQRLAEGVAPYVSVFDHKGPMASLAAGVFVQAARVLGVEDLLGVRFGFLLISAGAVCGMYALARELFRSPVLGSVAAFFF